METTITQINSCQRRSQNKWLWELGRTPHKQRVGVNLAALRERGAAAGAKMEESNLVSSQDEKVVLSKLCIGQGE